MAYRVTPQARRELDAALEFQAQEWGREAVHILDSAFDQVFERIGGWSPPGATRAEFARKEYRWVHVAPYPYNIVWAYGTNTDDRVIVRILQAQMDPKRAMRKTEPWK
jgi:plasmid stabilization system protein ParE